MNAIVIRKPYTRKEGEVWQACDKLHSENKALTYFAIGEQLTHLGYRRGSNSDIRRYLKTWQKTHQRMLINQNLSPTRETSDPSIPSLQAMTQIPSDLGSKENLLELFDFYQHHLSQVDRLARINALLKKENRLLRKKLNLDHSKEVSEKPRIVCK